MMKKVLLVSASLLFAGSALADWTGKDASNATITFKNSNACSSVVCVPIAQPVDSTGAAFGVTANPIFVAPGTGQTFPISTASLPLPSGAATSALQPTNAAIASTTAAQTGHLMMGAATTSSPSYTAAQTNPLSLTLAGALRVDGSAVTQPVSLTSTTITGTVAVNESQINGLTPLMGNGVTGAGSQRVTIASDNTAFSVNAIQSGTWNIGSITTLPALVAGSAIVGKVGIDQTTPGTTNLVSIGTNGTVNPQTLANWGLGATAAGVPANAHYLGASVAGTLTGLVAKTGASVASSDVGLVVSVANAAVPGQAAMSASSPVALASDQTVGDPCTFAAKTKVAISQATSTQVITGAASKKTYVCSIVLIGADAENISIVEGTGTVCATGIAAVLGGTTAANGINLAANGGITLGSGNGSVLQADGTNADNVCILQSGTGRVSGSMTFVQR